MLGLEVFAAVTSAAGANATVSADPAKMSLANQQVGQRTISRSNSARRWGADAPRVRRSAPSPTRPGDGALKSSMFVVTLEPTGEDAGRKTQARICSAFASAAFRLTGR